MPKRLAPLLPAEDGSEPPPFDSREDISKRKRVGTEIACNACRRRKTRCNGSRPACAACLKRSTECIYVEKRDVTRSGQSLEVSHEVLELLKSVPEPEAIKILRLLRANGDLASVLSIAKGDMNGVPSSSEQRNPRVLRPLRSSLEFELMVKNPIAYSPLRNTPLTALERDGLLSPNKRPRSKSLDHHSPLIIENGQQASESNDNRLAKAPSDGVPCNDDGPFCMTAFIDQNRGQKPDLCDPRLQQVDISFWTNVPIPNDYAAQIISLYLTTDHPLLGIFDPELFVMDLVDKRATYCSRLLVNSVLYWGCQMFTAIDEGASEFADIFCKEAERIWQTEENNDTIQNTASAQLLSLAYLGHGKDHYVLKYLAAALGMGRRLFLFGVEPKEALPHMERMSLEMQRAFAYTAWGVFNWGVLITLFYQQPGLDYPNHHPVLPIPGETVPGSKHDKSPSLSSDVSEEHIPSYMGRTFPTLCRFWRIVHEVTLVYYKDRQSPLSDLSLDFAEFKYRELLAWMDKLPSDQVLRDHCPHHVVIFHIWFHAAILDLFRPFTRQPRREQLHLKTFSARRSTPDAAFHASVNQLKHLVVKFRCNYESSTYTLLWQTALIYVANAVLHETDNPEWRFYFLVCIYGYEGLRKSYRVAEIVSRGLLSMTVRDGDISSNEARQLLDEIKEVEGSHAPGDVRATFMVDLDLAMVDPEAAKVENLAERFEDIALFRDFTTVNDEQETKRQQRADSVDSDS